MYARRYKKKAAPYKKRSTPYKKRSYKKGVSSFAVKKIVKMALARNIEKKTSQTLLLNAPFYYPAQGALYDTSNTLVLGPSSIANSITQGLGQNDRIGNKIQMKSLTIKGIFQPTPYDATVNPDPRPNQVKLVLFYDKTNLSSVPTPRTDFFQFGSTSAAILGEATDIMAPFNTDKYRILGTKTFKLGYSTYNGSSSDPVPQYYANNDFKMNYNLRWNLTKHHVKRLTYNDNTGEPSCRGLYMQVMISPADGNIGSAGVIPVTMQYWLNMNYTDA